MQKQKKNLQQKSSAKTEWRTYEPGTRYYSQMGHVQLLILMVVYILECWTLIQNIHKWYMHLIPLIQAQSQWI